MSILKQLIPKESIMIQMQKKTLSITLLLLKKLSEIISEAKTYAVVIFQKK